MGNINLNNKKVSKYLDSFLIKLKNIYYICTSIIFLKTMKNIKRVFKITFIQNRFYSFDSKEARMLITKTC
jgi:hypothetical protein